MTHRKTEDALWLMGGALVGAAAMYLLDPQAGDRRRRRLAAAAESAYENTRHAVGEKWRHAAADSADALTGQARDVAHHLTDRASRHASHLRDVGTRIWGRARDLAGRMADLGTSAVHHAAHAGEDLAHRAHDWRDWMSKRASKAKGRARSWVSHEEHHEGFGPGTFASTAVGCCAVGAGMMYFLDPNRGHSRRIHAYAQAVSCVRDTGHMMRSTGKQVADSFRRFFYGSRAFAREHLGGEQRVDSELLVGRLRAELGHYSPHAHRIQLMADADGTVTLTGSIASHEVDGLLTVLHRCPGVNHVVNRLDVDESAGSEKPKSASSPSPAGARG